MSRNRFTRNAAAGIALACLTGIPGVAHAEAFPWATQAGNTRWDLPQRDFSRRNELLGPTAISATLTRQLETFRLGEHGAAPASFAMPASSLFAAPAPFSTPALFTLPTSAPFAAKTAAAGGNALPAGQVGQKSAASATPILAPPPSPIRPAVATEPSVSASGGPNVFGSVAMRIGHTPLDGQWRRAGRSAGVRPAGFHQLRANGGNAVSRSQLDRVNRWVNSRADFVNDGGDRWAGAAELLARGAGDCEDFALAKLQLLRQLGFPAEDLYLVVVRDLVRRADHAVLVARLGDEMLMLDNNSDVIVDARRQMDYRPVFSYSSEGRWIHGYRHTPVSPVRTAALTLASAGTP